MLGIAYNVQCMHSYASTTVRLKIIVEIIIKAIGIMMRVVEVSLKRYIKLWTQIGQCNYRKIASETV